MKKNYIGYKVCVYIFESTVVLYIKLWIAMVVLLSIDTSGKLKFHFSLSDSTQFDFYQHQSEKAMDIF